MEKNWRWASVVAKDLSHEWQRNGVIGEGILPKSSLTVLKADTGFRNESLFKREIRDNEPNCEALSSCSARVMIKEVKSIVFLYFGCSISLTLLIIFKKIQNKKLASQFPLLLTSLRHCLVSGDPTVGFISTTAPSCRQSSGGSGSCHSLPFQAHSCLLCQEAQLCFALPQKSVCWF